MNNEEQAPGASDTTIIADFHQSLELLQKSHDVISETLVEMNEEIGNLMRMQAELAKLVESLFKTVSEHERRLGEGAKQSSPN